MACGEEKKFGGEVVSAEVPAEVEPEKGSNVTPAKPTTPDVKPPSVVVPSDTSIPAACGENKGEITKVTLLSTGINLDISDQVLEYELSVVSCKDGAIVPIKNQSLSFDLNLVTENGYRAIEYSVIDPSSSKTIDSGELETIEGSDLFGNVGNFGHWVTKSLSYSSNLDKVVLQIDLKNIKLSSSDLFATNADSFLQVGDATAVKQSLKILH